MGGSIRACIREKNRWSGKAMFTGNQESVAVRFGEGVWSDAFVGTPPGASPLPQGNAFQMWERARSRRRRLGL